MKSPLFWCLSHFAFALLASVTRAAGPRDAAWSEVQSAIRQDLPQMAIERLEPIIAGALADKAYAEAVNGIAAKIVLHGRIQGNKPEEKITRLQAELAQAPTAIKPLLEGLLAQWYWQYFQQNRWRIAQRTTTSTAPGSDLQTWDLARLLAEIDRHFTAALSDEATLKASPIAAWDSLLPIGTVTDVYRPTLYDFLAYEALRFYQAGEHASTVAEDEFEIDAASPIFSSPTDFLRWTPQTTDVNSPKRKAIRLYQALLKFHQSDTYRAAYYDADLARLTYGHNVARGEDKDERYKASLERFIEDTDGHEISARALAALATQLNNEKDPVAAHAAAQRGFDAFPETAGGALCFNIIQQIEAKSAALETEFVWNAPWPTLDLTYRNVTKVYFRAIAVDFPTHIQDMRRSNFNDREYRDKLLASRAALEWSATLPPTTDFQSRTEKLPAPTKLEPGFYVIVASHEPTFAANDNQLSLSPVWVSNLALVSRISSDDGKHGGFVLQAGSGEPVAGALVKMWEHGDRGELRPLPAVETDRDGKFQFTASGRGVVLLAEYLGHSVSSHELYLNRPSDGDHVQTETVFFTDRAIYRPGQTINYKGVSLRYDQDAASYAVVAGKNFTVVFRDVNNQEIARTVHRTNDYGSFSGVFTAPRDRLLGNMSIHVLDQTGQTDFQVEEYKRPKFRAEIDAPLAAAKLGEPVTLTTRAIAYTGAAIGGAKVQWRVERAVNFPAWCWWWWGTRPAPKAIAHGTAITQPDGTYQISFPADPDRSVPARDEPVFAFTVSIDVTDTTGETRSERRTIRAGYTALQASLDAAEWHTPDQPVEISLATKSLDGDPQPASGTVTVYALRQPRTVERAPLPSSFYRPRSLSSDPAKPDPANPDSWELGAKVATLPFQTDAAGAVKLHPSLKVGIYRASLETTDRFGKKVTARRTIEVIAPRDSHYPIKRANRFVTPKWSYEPGETFSAVWGTGYDSGRAYVEVECNGQRLQSYWTSARRTQERIDLPVTAEMRGGFTVRVTYVRENRAYIDEHTIGVPWTDRQLAVKWDRFRSKLVPGQPETWTATITGPGAKGEAAELVAALYDASLDQYAPHRWPQSFAVFRQESPAVSSEFHNSHLLFNLFHSWDRPASREPNWRYRAYPPELVDSSALYRSQAVFRDAARFDGSGGTVQLSAFSVSETREGTAQAIMAGARMAGKAAASFAAPSPAPDESPTVPPPDLTKVTARKNLSETAFFFPHVLAKSDGTLQLTFTMPEALTEWKFLGFAHDKQLRSGFLTAKVVTAKDLMVEPNPPRFVREGDELEFTVKVSNQSDQPQTGTVKLTFADAATLASVDAALGLRATEQAFDLPAKQSRSYSWRIAVPDGLGFLTFKAVAASASVSDGEEGFLPVLSRRVLVAESLPLPIRGVSTKQFAFEKLLGSAGSDTLRHQSLTVQMTSQPAWYAVMALPYLMEYPYECSEQVFNRLYANALARHLAASDPKIRRIFDLWKNTPALDSPLEKNRDLKSVMLEETPWLRQAKAEGGFRRNVGLLFDANRLDEETARALRTLAERQRNDGLWPWFPGGPGSEYISLYLTTGFGRLRHLGVTLDAKPAVKSLASLDAWMTENHRRILKTPKPEDYVPSSLDALYLYGRSFFLADRPIAPAHRAAVDFFLAQARKLWMKQNSRQSQAHLALALQRFGDTATPAAIMASLKERSVTDPELGRFWRDTEQGWWWYHAPIETQALMIEAFAEVTNDTAAVEDCKVWLLKQKQTQDWKTTKATADAIYGLLLRGTNLLSSDALVEVSLAGQTVTPTKVEAGTGFYEAKFTTSEVKPAMGQITVKKSDEGVSWGSAHWQYLEDIAKITPHEGTPLKLKKSLFIRETTAKGPVLKPVTGPVTVGDELVVRLELRTDRDMEYVHLKDQRGSGTEPVNVVSRYRFQDGLSYYESTRDTATHFFIDYLRKGVYVFEYSTRVQLKGRYQTGLAEIQCMYAPEFNSHSESLPLEVR